MMVTSASTELALTIVPPRVLCRSDFGSHQDTPANAAVHLGQVRSSPDGRLDGGAEVEPFDPQLGQVPINGHPAQSIRTALAAPSCSPSSPPAMACFSVLPHFRIDL